MSSVDATQSVRHSSDEAFTQLCDPCIYSSVHRQATHYCNDCQEYLCNSCTDSHRGLKILRNHSLSEIFKETFYSPGVTCTVAVSCDCDQNVGVTEFCSTHNEVICHSCKLIKHRNCKTKSLNECGKSYKRENLAVTADKANAIQEGITQSLEKRNITLDNLEITRKGCFDDIEHFTKQLNDFFITLKEKSLKDASDHAEKMKLELESDIASLSTTHKMLEKDINYIKAAMESSCESDMFALDIKISKRLVDYEKLLHDVYREDRPPKMKFQRNTELTGIQNTIQTLGIVDIFDGSKWKRKSFLNMSVKDCRKIDTETLGRTMYVTGLVIMPDGDIVICDRNIDSTLRRFSSTFELKESLQLLTWIWDASAIDSANIIVSLPDKLQLQYIAVQPKLKKGRALSVGVSCYGIDVVGNEIYISCFSGQGIRVLDLEGNLKRKINLSVDIFSEPYHFKVKQDKIYVSDSETHNFVRLNLDGSVDFKHHGEDLIRPRGFCVDDDGHSVVCDVDSHNLKIIDTDANNVSTFLSNRGYDLERPHHIVFNAYSNTFIVGFSDGGILMLHMA